MRAAVTSGRQRSCVFYRSAIRSRVCLCLCLAGFFARGVSPSVNASLGAGITDLQARPLSLLSACAIGSFP